MYYSYVPTRVCARKIEFEISEDLILHNIHFTGGCNGNLKAICKLLEGQSAEIVIEKLMGNDCNGKGTSCADQLAKAVIAAKKEMGKD